MAFDGRFRCAGQRVGPRVCSAGSILALRPGATFRPSNFSRPRPRNPFRRHGFVPCVSHPLSLSPSHPACLPADPPKFSLPRSLILSSSLSLSFSLSLSLSLSLPLVRTRRRCSKRAPWAGGGGHFGTALSSEHGCEQCAADARSSFYGRGQNKKWPSRRMQNPRRGDRCLRNQGCIG